MVYRDDGIRVSKGPNFSVRIAQPTPTGEVSTDMPLSEVARMIEILSGFMAEQAEAHEAELRKWIEAG